MAHVKCNECRRSHILTAEQMAVILERMQEGYGHTVGRDWVNGGNKFRTTQIRSRCLLDVAGILAYIPNKRGGRRKGA